MLQVRKSRFCVISVTFFQCSFMSETVTSINDFSDFSGFFLGSFPGRELDFLSGGMFWGLPIRGISFDGWD